MTESVAIEEVIRALQEITDEYAESLPPDGDWEPMLFIFKGELSTSTTFPMPPNGPMRDFLFETIIPNQVRPAEPDAVVILVSAWATAASVDEEELNKIEAGEAPLPSERPDRREVLLIQGVSKEGEAGAMAEIIRSEGHPELDWEIFPTETGEFQGRLMTAIRRGVWG
jgi:hypothetical protein